MLRDTSEIAVAITVKSLPLNPTFAARSRPRCRAVTMSASLWMGTRNSVVADMSRLQPALQQQEPFVQIECCRDAVEREAELHHRHRDVGLDADDNRLGTSQPGG